MVEWLCFDTLFAAVLVNGIISFFALKVNIYLQNMSIKRCLVRFDQKNMYFHYFLCATCLRASLIMHVPVSEVHAQWHLSMSLISQCLLMATNF